MRYIVFLAVLSLLLTCSSVVVAKEYVLGGDNFEGYTVGTIFRSTLPNPPTGWSDVWGDSATYTASPLRCDVIEKAELDLNPDNQVVHAVDRDPANAKYVHLRTDFCQTPYLTSGVYSVTMDVKPLQDNGPFKISMTSGPDWTAGRYWNCALGFGSTANNTYFGAGTAAGAKLFLLRTTTIWDDSGQTYAANTWYTVKFIVDVDLREYQAFIGPRGGALTEVTKGPTQWTYGSTAPPTTYAGMIIATSGTVGDVGELLLDNVVETQLPVDRSKWIVWDSVYRADSGWPLGTTEDPNHYSWENGFNSLAQIKNHEWLWNFMDDASDGLILNNYAPSAVDISARMRSIPDLSTATNPDGSLKVTSNGAGIGYRCQSRTVPGRDPETGNPGFGYKLSWPQDGSSVKLSYQWWGGDVSSTTYTPATPIDWTVYHVVRIRAVGSSHKVWLDGTLIIDWTDGNRLTGGDIVFFRDHAELHMDDFVVQDTSVPVSSVLAAKALDVGASVVLSGSGFCVSGAYLSGGSPAFFYLEDFNRAAGIKVVSPTFVGVGNLVTVKGTVNSADGEKYIDATSVVPDSSSFVIEPFGMNGRSHGAVPGLSNIGLLTMVYGKATFISPDFTYCIVDDGSGVSHEDGVTGIKVRGEASLPAQGDYVMCTGVASMDPGGIPVIRMRSYLDLVIVRLADSP